MVNRKRGRPKKVAAKTVEGDVTSENVVDKVAEDGPQPAKREKVSSDEIDQKDNLVEKTENSKEQVYKRNALAIAEALCKEFGEVEVSRNPSKPRSKSFELTIIKDDGTEYLVWSGIKKGPPRKLKFPDSLEIIAAVKKQI